MNASLIQAMIARNAATITRESAIMGSYIEFAKEDAAAGNKSFAADWYKHADKKRSKVAALVTLQRSMLAQLKATYRATRIQKKLARLNAVLVGKGQSFGVALDPTKTGIEQEEMLDFMLSAYA